MGSGGSIEEENEFFKGLWGKITPKRSIWGIVLPSHWWMHIIKQSLNYVFSRLDVPKVERKWQISEYIWELFNHIIARVEEKAEQEPFKSEPEANLDNFLRLLRAARDCIILICEEDQFYRQWVEYAFVKAAQIGLRNLDYDALKNIANNRACHGCRHENLIACRSDKPLHIPGGGVACMLCKRNPGLDKGKMKKILEEWGIDPEGYPIDCYIKRLSIGVPGHPLKTRGEDG